MRTIRFAAVMLLLLIPSALLRAAETEDYDISHYRLSFDTREGSADVRVEMVITYRIRSGTKSTGFKFIGSQNATNLTGADEDGRPIRAWVDRPRETRLNWSFDAAGRGEKKIVLTFDIPGALTGSLQSNTLDISWAGTFRIPVHDAVYRFLLPDDSERAISAGTGAVVRVEGGRRIVELQQDSIGRESFRVTFAPGLVQNLKRSTAPTRVSSPYSELRMVVPMLLMIFGILIFFGIMAAAAAKRAGGQTGSKGGMFSSCAGASSCGGGGGGCGGGGCGGGGCGG
jgi:hypothetical protein